ncbi:extracellular solute-binding protein [Halorubrum amylolyticum]|uniref:extracellular solute-binding protein n=1 Tax=Halorubrum amylolyticum TaxID=2508724 RepID=UPI0010087F73
MGGSTAIAALAGCVSTGGDGSDDSGGSDGAGGSDGSNGSDGSGGSDGGAAGSAMVWADLTDAEDEDVDAYIADFEEETGYAIDKEAPGGELDQQLETAIPAGDGPDSWIWAHDWVGRFAVREDPPFLYDARDDVDVSLDDYTETAQQAAQFDGGLYGLPFASETAALYYNADMVEEPPETLAEMVSIMEEHHDPDNGQYGLSFPGIDPYQASGFIQAYGGDLFDEENLEVTVDSDACKRGMDALETLYEYMPADPGYESQIVAFADGLAPFAINGPWELGNLQSEVDDLGVTTLPTVDGNNPRSYSGVQLFYFSAMLADADQSTVDAATGLAEWYTTNPEIIRSNAESQGYIPVLGEVVESGDVADEVQAFAQQVEHGVPMPSHPDMDSVWTPVEDALERVFNGDQESDAALDQAASEIREAL